MKRISFLAVALIASSLFARPAGANDAPQITNPAAGVTVPGATAVHFSGTAAPSTTVSLFDAATGETFGSASTDEAGVWAQDVPLSDGSHTVYAVDNNSIAQSDSVGFVVDAIRPSARVTSPKDQTIFGPGQTPQLNGAAIDDRGVLAVQIEYWLLNKMIVRKNAPCVCDTPNATWSDNPALGLPGYYVAKITAIDAAGNRSETMNLTFFDSGIHDGTTLPTTPDAPKTPKPPVIQNPITGTDIPGAGSDPHDGVPVVIGGMAQPGSRVDIYETREGDGWWGRTIADGRSGRWSVLTHLDGGTYGVQARATNAQGRRSPFSVLVSFSVDTLRPTVDPQVDAADPKVFLPFQPVVISGRTADDHHVIAVHLEYWLGSRLVLVENASCPACGSSNSADWTDAPKLADPGYYYVNINSIDEAGNRSLTDSIRFVRVIQ